MIYKFSAEEKNEVIRKLADQYPKTFFDNPRLRVPLMRNMVTALQKDGFPIVGELTSESIDWYKSHLAISMHFRPGQNVLI
jgi:hypothetical protein